MDRGTLYIVGTPIGNLKDITIRAKETLDSVDVIACEDTRHSLTLLSSYGIKKPLISYYKQKEHEGTDEIRSLLDEGKNVAIITDAGMPCISDPGAVAVRILRKEGYTVCSVPGATAVTTAISLVGPEQNGFCFIGFLPEKTKDKVSLISKYASIPCPLVFYCAPHDLKDTLSFLYNELGERKVYAVKELTKMFESVCEGTLNNIDIPSDKGEFVLIVEGNEQEIGDNVDAKALLKKALESGMSRSESVKSVAKATGLSKNELYSLSLEM